MQLEEIIVSGVVALIVAFLAVYFDRWLSAKHEYQQLIRGLKTEIRENQNIAENILAFLEDELEHLKSQTYCMGVTPRLLVEVWRIAVMRGYPLKLTSELCNRLQEYYRWAEIVNTVQRSREELIFGSMIEREPFYSMLRNIDESTRKIIQGYVLPLGKKVDELIVA